MYKAEDTTVDQCIGIKYLLKLGCQLPCRCRRQAAMIRRPLLLNKAADSCGGKTKSNCKALDPAQPSILIVG
jgi:hypothetical protein